MANQSNKSGVIIGLVIIMAGNMLGSPLISWAGAFVVIAAVVFLFIGGGLGGSKGIRELPAFPQLPEWVPKPTNEGIAIYIGIGIVLGGLLSGILWIQCTG